MSGQSGARFSYAETRPYVIVDSLDDLQGPDHGVMTLPHELAWSGRTDFDLDDGYDRAAFYKIVLEEGIERHLAALLNSQLLVRHWAEINPARHVRARWEQRFTELRSAA